MIALSDCLCESSGKKLVEKLVAILPPPGVDLPEAPPNPEELERALGRAFDLFADPACWQRLIHAAMRQPVGWRWSADAYKAVYEEAMKAKPLLRHP